MKNDKFIKVTLIAGQFQCYINSMAICGITDCVNYRKISTIGSENFSVKETIAEIFKLIEKSENITFITK